MVSQDKGNSNCFKQKYTGSGHFSPKWICKALCFLFGFYSLSFCPMASFSQMFMEVNEMCVTSKNSKLVIYILKL